MQGSHQPIEFFCSYAHEDEPLLQKLEAHLSGLKRQGLISTWHDRQICAGVDWAQAIDTHLNSASVILLLISPDFFASGYCYGIEMEQALQRHQANEARVIPIVLRPVDWRGAPFAHLQVLPTDAKPVTSWSNQDEAFADITAGIHRAIENLTAFSASTHHTVLPLATNIPYPHNVFINNFLGLTSGVVIGEHNRVDNQFDEAPTPHRQSESAVYEREHPPAAKKDATDQISFTLHNSQRMNSGSFYDEKLQETLGTLFWHRADELKTQSALRESKGGSVFTNQPEQVDQSLYSPPSDDMMFPLTLDFVGRVQDLNWLINTLKTYRIAMLRGMGGIGKSTLASVAIKRLRKEGEYPDGVIVIDCKDLVSTDELVQKTVVKLIVQSQPPQVQKQSLTIELAKQIMRSKKILILLDNIEPEMRLENFIPPFYELGATLLITARHSISPTTIPREVCRYLRALPLSEAMEVFSRAFGKREIKELRPIEYEEVKKIVKLLDCHTLAVKLAGSYANETGRELSILAESLKDPLNALVLPDGERSKAVAKIFNQSMEKLPLEARKLFIAIASYASLDIGRKSIVALARSLGINEPETVIDILIKRSLLDTYNATSKNLRGDVERVRLHPLLFAIVRSEFSKWTKEETNFVLDTILLYYLEYSSDKSLKVIDLDLENIIHSLEWAYKRKQYRKAFWLSVSMHDTVCLFRRASYILKCIPLAINAAKKMVIQAKDHETITVIEGMIMLWMIYYASALRESHKLKEALTCANDALALAQKLQDSRGMGAVYEELGRIEKDLNHFNEATSHFNNALSYRQNADQWFFAIENMLSIAKLFQQQGRNEEAIQLYRKSLVFCETLETNEHLTHLKAEGYISLSVCIQTPEAKKECIEQALAQALSLSSNFALPIYLRLGFMALQAKQLDDAKTYFDYVLQLSTQSTKKSVMLIVYIGLMLIACLRDRFEETMQYHNMVLEVRSEIEEDVTPIISDLLSQLEAVVNTGSNGTYRGINISPEAIR